MRTPTLLPRTSSETVVTSREGLVRSSWNLATSSLSSEKSSGLEEEGRLVQCSVVISMKDAADLVIN